MTDAASGDGAFVVVRLPWFLDQRRLLHLGRAIADDHRAWGQLAAARAAFEAATGVDESRRAACASRNC